jgi:hypothetical protein
MSSTRETAEQTIDKKLLPSCLDHNCFVPLPFSQLLEDQQNFQMPACILVLQHLQSKVLHYSLATQ